MTQYNIKSMKKSASSSSSPEDTYKPTVLGFRIFLLLFLTTLLALWFLFPLNPTWIEQVYSQGIYVTLSNWLVPLLDKINISVTGIILAILLLCLVFSFLSSLKRGKRGVTRRYKLGLWLLNVLIWLGALGVSFIVLWGANYQRESIETQLNLPEKVVSAEEVRLLAEKLFEVILTNYAAEQNVSKALIAVSDSLAETVSEIHGKVPTLPQQIKYLPKGTLLYLGNSTGVISPWLLEVHVDSALPAAEFVAVAAHELAHVAGYAGEADADLLATMAGLTADDGFVRYAVALRIFRTLVYQLSGNENLAINSLPEGWQENLPQQALQDWEVAINASQRYAAPENYSRLQRRVYNNYLRSQGVSVGIADYSRVIKLLVLAQQQGLIFGEGASEQIKIELNPIQ